MLMKLAIVHDYLNQMGGAERVLLTLHEIFPQAPIYTSIYAPQLVDPGWRNGPGHDHRRPAPAKPSCRAAAPPGEIQAYPSGYAGPLNPIRSHVSGCER